MVRPCRALVYSCALQPLKLQTQVGIVSSPSTSLTDICVFSFPALQECIALGLQANERAQQCLPPSHHEKLLCAWDISDDYKDTHTVPNTWNANDDETYKDYLITYVGLQYTMSKSNKIQFTSINDTIFQFTKIPRAARDHWELLIKVGTIRLSPLGVQRPACSSVGAMETPSTIWAFKFC